MIKTIEKQVTKIEKVEICDKCGRECVDVSIERMEENYKHDPRIFTWLPYFFRTKQTVTTVIKYSPIRFHKIHPENIFREEEVDKTYSLCTDCVKKFEEWLKND